MRTPVYLFTFASMVLFVSAQLAREDFTRSFVSASSTIQIESSGLNDSIIEDSTAIEVVTGKFIFDIDCQQCHGVVVSHEFDTEGWTAVVGRMSSKAGLDSLQCSNLTSYIHWELENTDTSIVYKTQGMGQW